MDLKMIESLIKAVDNSSINMFEFEVDGARIKLQKTPDGNMNSINYNENKTVSGDNSGIPAKQDAEAKPHSEKVGKNPVSDKYHVIKSPIVGAYYEAAMPGKSAFVKLGDRVTKGQTVCIIEAMKVMNEIESDVNGVIMDILASDGKTVEFGQDLFKIKVD